MLVIAHRLSTITDADKIVVLKNGCIEGAGTQEELLQNCQLYQRMWQAHVGARHWQREVRKKVKTHVWHCKKNYLLVWQF